MSIHPVVAAACPTLSRLAVTHPDIRAHLEDLPTCANIRSYIGQQVGQYLTGLPNDELPPIELGKAICEWTDLIHFVDTVLAATSHQEIS
jgi:hypothetical protein